MTEPDVVIRVGDWVQLPQMPNDLILSYRLAKVIDIEHGDVALVSIAAAGEHRIAIERLKKITWATPYEPPIPNPLGPGGEGGPFCRCGEPVGVPGAACRTHRLEEFVTEWYAWLP